MINIIKNIFILITCTMYTTFQLNAHNTFFEKLLPQISINIVTQEIAALTYNGDQTEIFDNVTPKNLCITIGKEFIKNIYVTLCHELGHATAVKILTGESTRITLGTRERKKPYLSLGNIDISGMNPTEGFINFTSPYKKFLAGKTSLSKEVSQRKEALILIAGGISAIIGYALACYVLKKYNFLKTSEYVYDPLFLDPIIIEQLLSMLYPAKNDYTLFKSDGYLMWKNYGNISTETLDALSKLGPIIELYLKISAQMYKALQNAHVALSKHT